MIAVFVSTIAAGLPADMRRHGRLVPLRPPLSAEALRAPRGTAQHGGQPLPSTRRRQGSSPTYHSARTPVLMANTPFDQRGEQPLDSGYGKEVSRKCSLSAGVQWTASHGLSAPHRTRMTGGGGVLGSASNTMLEAACQADFSIDKAAILTLTPPTPPLCWLAKRTRRPRH